jgi:hypothetical protein
MLGSIITLKPELFFSLALPFCATTTKMHLSYQQFSQTSDGDWRILIGRELRSPLLRSDGAAESSGMRSAHVWLQAPGRGHHLLHSASRFDAVLPSRGHSLNSVHPEGYSAKSFYSILNCFHFDSCLIVFLRIHGLTSLVNTSLRQIILTYFVLNFSYVNLSPIFNWKLNMRKKGEHYKMF